MIRDNIQVESSEGNTPRLTLRIHQTGEAILKLYDLQTHRAACDTSRAPEIVLSTCPTSKTWVGDLAFSLDCLQLHCCLPAVHHDEKRFSASPWYSLS